MSSNPVSKYKTVRVEDTAVITALLVFPLDTEMLGATDSHYLPSTSAPTTVTCKCPYVIA